MESGQWRTDFFTKEIEMTVRSHCLTA